MRVSSWLSRCIAGEGNAPINKAGSPPLLGASSSVIPKLGERTPELRDPAGHVRDNEKGSLVFQIDDAAASSARKFIVCLYPVHRLAGLVTALRAGDVDLFAIKHGGT